MARQRPKMWVTANDVSIRNLREKSVGRGVDFLEKFAFFKRKKCFDPKGELGADRLIEKFYEIKSDRFNNLIRNRALFLPKELQFFMDCVIYVYGEETAKTISSEELRSDKADILFNKLERRSYHKDWENYDPVHSLLNLATKRDKLYLKLDIAATKFPGQDDEDMNEKLSLPSYDPVHQLSQYDSIRIEVHKEPDELVGDFKPIVMAIAHQDGIKLNGELTRARLYSYVYPNPKRVEYEKKYKEETYWIVSRKKSDEYMPMKNINGHFTILAIYGAGEDGLALLPKGTHPKHISTQDLKELCKNLEVVSKRGDSIGYGILHYQVF